MEIKIKKIKNGKIPTYETEGSAGADCYARIDEKIIVKPKTVETISLGFAVEIPEGYEMQIRGRSGNARKKWVQVFNSPGTIDSDYRGEVGAILYNASDVDFEVNPFDRIAQAVIAPVIQAKWEEVEELSETKRGTGGFGSTGISENKKEIEMSWPHKVEEFYEPFKKINQVENYLDKEVTIDNSFRAIVEAVKVNEFNTLIIEFKINDDERISMNSLQAFERVKINNHRFGVGINFEERWT